MTNKKFTCLYTGPQLIHWKFYGPLSAGIRDAVRAGRDMREERNVCQSDTLDVHPTVETSLTD
jgi:hypothetical protein